MISSFEILRGLSDSAVIYARKADGNFFLYVMLRRKETP